MDGSDSSDDDRDIPGGKKSKLQIADVLFSAFRFDQISPKTSFYLIFLGS